MQGYTPVNMTTRNQISGDDGITYEDPVTSPFDPAQSMDWMTPEERAQIMSQARVENGITYLPNSVMDYILATSPYKAGNPSSGLENLMNTLSVIGTMYGFGAGAASLFGGAAGGAGAGAVGESVMAGGYGANLAANGLGGLGVGTGATGLSLGEVGAGSILGGGAGSVVAGGAGALGLSAETVAALQSLGYSGAEIASMGGNALNGLTGGTMGAASGAGGAALGSTGLPTLPTGATQAGSALSRLLNGTATTEDYLSLAGKLGLGALSAYGTNQQTQAYKDAANQYQAMGAPYRQRLSDLYANPSSFLSSPEVQVPVQQGTDMLSRSLSIKGNPAGSGNALQQLQSYSADQLFGKLGQEKDRLAGFGGLSNYNAAAPAATNASIAANGQTLTNLGGTLNDVFNPVKSQTQQLADLMKIFKG